MHYVRALRFEDRPDYSGIRQIFKQLLTKSGYEYDHLFDWVMVNQSHIGENIFTVDSFEEIRFHADKGKVGVKTESMDGQKEKVEEENEKD